MTGVSRLERVPPNAIPVVAAVVVRSGRVLLCQRHEGPHLPLLWEFPGGKVDPGESATRALERELREELGVRARVRRRVAEVVHSYPEKSVWIRFYATSISGEPRAVVHRQVRWVPLPSLGEFDVPPPNAVVVSLILGGELEIH